MSAIWLTFLQLTPIAYLMQQSIFKHFPAKLLMITGITVIYKFERNQEFLLKVKKSSVFVKHALIKWEWDSFLYAFKLSFILQGFKTKCHEQNIWFSVKLFFLSLMNYRTQALEFLARLELWWMVYFGQIINPSPKNKTNKTKQKRGKTRTKQNKSFKTQNLDQFVCFLFVCLFVFGTKIWLINSCEKATDKWFLVNSLVN